MRPTAKLCLCLASLPLFLCCRPLDAAALEEPAAQSVTPVDPAPIPTEQASLRLSWGHRSPSARRFHLSLAGNHLAVNSVRPEDLEGDDAFQDGECVSRAGDGDVDALITELSWTKPTERPRKVHSIWRYLLDHGTPGQVARLEDDPGLQPEAPILNVLMAEDGAQGFSLGLEQLIRHRAMWLPEHDVFVTIADEPVEYAAHLAALKGERILDRIRHEPEATLADWTAKWADFGDPTQPNHGHETEWLGTKGHLTGLIARHGSLYKFGVDRWGRVRPDYASPHRFRFDPLWSDGQWKGQRIENGLPVLLTTIESEGKRYQVEQFAAPLHDSPPQRRGEIASVVFTKIKITGSGPLRLGFRLSTETTNRHPELRKLADRWCVVDRETGSVWLAVEAVRPLTVQPRPPIADGRNPRVEFDVVGQLDGNVAAEMVFKLAAPVVPANEAPQLAALDFTRSRSSITQYWKDWLARGAHFAVPEQAVNDLFRANLWHALFLPRHRTDEQGVDRIDLPYSNFAYGQSNADWPINQAVYVDYMIHGLRGYFDVAEAEFAAMYQTQQQPDGRVAGYANWGVYTPSMLYSIGQNYLLSGDRNFFERLLPASLKALDWCLGEVRKGKQNPTAPGLIVAPLNDLTHASRAWAFPNGYFVAGLDRFARALAVYGHARAAEVRTTAEQMRRDVTRAFARASVRSPVVQLADGTWNNYVPCDAMTPRRLLDEWYPTDVDSGPAHLARLEAIDPRGWLTTAMLHDHEDNLFFKQWGMANEPVYNQQVTAYLLRDEPEAAIRAFYSMMACTFSHHQLTPLEHRWAWGQYYMPPSTDGAWFELYRRMLIRETDENALLLCQAAPRKWFEAGKRITVQAAPTCFGVLSFSVDSQTDQGRIVVTIQTPNRNPPKMLLTRLRHPAKKRIRSVEVNGQGWQEFDLENEWVRIPTPAAESYRIVVSY